MGPYYDKVYTLHEPQDAMRDHLGIDWINPDLQRTSGPIQVSFQGALGAPLSKAWVQMFKNLGLGIQADPFTGETIGGYSNPISVDPLTKTRSYAANTYLRQAADRNNLTLVTNALVRKVSLERMSSGVVRAMSVEVQSYASIYKIRACREVVLAAGVFQSPKLLELSGIGSAELLKTNSIPGIIDNANVGENLQDHLLTGISFEVNKEVPTGDSLMRQEQEVFQSAMHRYNTAKDGPLCRNSQARSLWLHC